MPDAQIVGMLQRAGGWFADRRAMPQAWLGPARYRKLKVESGGIDLSGGKGLKPLEQESSKLKRLVAAVRRAACQEGGACVADEVTQHPCDARRAAWWRCRGRASCGLPGFRACVAFGGTCVPRALNLACAALNYSEKPSTYTFCPKYWVFSLKTIREVICDTAHCRYFRRGPTCVL
jgi:hypothetical protein